MVERKFNVIKLLGSGVYGCVFKVFDKVNGIPLAMKQVRSGSLQKRCNEVEILKRISSRNESKNCISFDTSFVHSDGYRYIILSYDGKHTLYDYLVHQKPFNIKLCIQDILNGLQYIHNVAKIAHRDLKPSNILVKRTSIPEKCLEFTIADFGCARELVDYTSNPNACVS